MCIRTILSVFAYLESKCINSNDQGLSMFKSSIFISFTDNPDKTEPYVCKAAYSFK